MIPGESDATGALVVRSAGLMAGTVNLPDRTFFSYEYDAANSRFVIQSRELIPDANTPWGRSPTLRDGDLYFAWVDFTNPLGPPLPCPGDLDGDGDVDLGDLATLLAQFGSVGPGFSADIDGDGDVDLSDLTILLANFGSICA